LAGSGEKDQIKIEMKWGNPCCFAASEIWSSRMWKIILQFILQPTNQIQPDDNFEMEIILRAFR